MSRWRAAHDALTRGLMYLLVVVGLTVFMVLMALD